MQQKNGVSRFLRFVGIVLMALTAGFTVLAGVGGICAAAAPTNWASLAPLASYQWLYVVFVIVTTAIGAAGIRATICLIRGQAHSYRDALIALIAGVIVGAIHIAVSRALRGASMPVDMVVYVTVFTLAVLLLLRVPGIWKGVDYTRGNGAGRLTTGATAIILGGLTLLIPLPMAMTHTWDGINYADAFSTTMTVVGGVLLATGIAVLIAPRPATRPEPIAVPAAV
ncbi:MAG TPA: hypothetical protein PKZ61_03045 [Thermoflexales bacterium]|nr:hypothetical protein [Thermoflexales bacterium]